jgi:hypothetical protein
MLAPVLFVDDEGDQISFFKPSHDELRSLYGLQVQELTVWQPLLTHAQTLLARGTLVATESSAFWLPDTHGTDYRRSHAKTSITLAAIDAQAEVLHYFHNTGLHRMEGEDFRRTFRVGEAPDATHMPLFAELIRTDSLVRRPAPELATLAHEALRRRLPMRPRHNPVASFGQRFAAGLPALQAAGLGHYHAWAFSNTRQLGAAMELGALFLRWLDTHLGQPQLQQALHAAADAFERISQGQKALILKGARSVNSGKPLDASAAFAEMAQDWENGMAQLAKAA